MEKKISEDEIPCNIPDSAFSEFQSMITQDKIFEFFNKTKIYTEKVKNKDNSHKLNKTNFISICQNIFSLSKNPYFNNIYELIFERFKEKKCIFTMNTAFSPNIFSLSDIVSTEKIEIYIIEIFFCVIMQTEFKKKLETMFLISDSDSDGLINEIEIKKLILTTNKLFCEQTSQYNSGSTLIQQSLSNLNAKKALDTLLYGPAELRKQFWICKYISFEQFYNCLIKIENYKYIIIPTFINLKKCLLAKRKEIEFHMNKNCKKDFLKISYELINRNNNFTSTRNILRKCFDPKKIKPKKKVDPLKEIKAKKEKEREYKLKRMIQIKKKEYKEKGKEFYETSSSFYKNKTNKYYDKIKNDINYSDNKFKYNSANKNQKEIISEEFSDTNNDNDNDTDNDKNKTQYRKINPLKKLNSLDSQNIYKDYFQEKINLIKRKSANPNTILNSLSLKKKGILRSPLKVSPFFNQTNSSLYKNNNTNLNKIVSFSDNIELKHSLSQQSQIGSDITTTNFNLDTNFSSEKKASEEISLNNIKFNKIPLIDMIKIEKTKSNINNEKIKTIFKKINKIKDNNNNNNSKVKIIYRNKSVLSRRNTLNPFININNKKYIEKGDYNKFTSIVFPPCIISTKEKNDNYFITNRKKGGGLTHRNKKINLDVSKNNEIDEYNCLLKTFDEIKDEVLYELEQQKNNDIHGLGAILKIKKSVEDKKADLPLVDLSKNQVETMKSFLIMNKKEKK